MVSYVVEAGNGERKIVAIEPDEELCVCGDKRSSHPNGGCCKFNGVPHAHVGESIGGQLRARTGDCLEFSPLPDMTLFSAKRENV